MDIEQIKRDRDAGTPGDWSLEYRKGPDGAFRMQVFPVDDPDNTIATVHWHSIPHGKGFRTDRDSLARRIARLPDLEEAYIAARAERDALAEKLARAVEALGEISRQKRTDELATELDVEYADFEGGYDQCIDRARALDPAEIVRAARKGGG